MMNSFGITAQSGGFVPMGCANANVAPQGADTSGRGLALLKQIARG